MKQILRLSVLLCALILESAAVQAQTQFLDAYFNILPVADKAKYTREVSVSQDSSYKVVIRYITGEVMMTGAFSDQKLQVQNGDFTYYYANGNLESQGRYKSGLKVGTWKRWSFDGSKKPDRYYPDENFKAKTRSTNPAKFPGGMSALQKLITDSLKYPTEAKERGLEGTVYVTFTVDATGEVSRPEVSEGVHYLLNEEAVRFVSAMPTWTPASKNGSPIDSSFIMPITFNLGNRSSQNIQKDKPSSTKN